MLCREIVVQNIDYALRDKEKNPFGGIPFVLRCFELFNGHPAQRQEISQVFPEFFVSLYDRFLPIHHYARSSSLAFTLSLK